MSEVLKCLLPRFLKEFLPVVLGRVDKLWTETIFPFSEGFPSFSEFDSDFHFVFGYDSIDPLETVLKDLIMYVEFGV